MDPLLARITIDPAVCHGKPCIRGLRYPVETLLELLSSGMTIDEVLADYEDLERDDLLAAFAFAARLARTRRAHAVRPCTSSSAPSGPGAWLAGPPLPVATPSTGSTCRAATARPTSRSTKCRPRTARGGHEGRGLRRFARSQ